MSVIKQFYKPEPVEINIEFLSGQKKIFVIESFTHDQVKRMNELSTIIDPSSDGFTVIMNQLAIIFGGIPEDFEGIDFRTGKQVIDYVLGLLQNPTPDKGK